MQISAALQHYRALPFELRTKILRHIPDEAQRVELALADFRDPTRRLEMSAVQNQGERRALMQIPGVPRAALADDAATYRTAHRLLTETLRSEPGVDLISEATGQLVSFATHPEALAGLAHLTAVPGAAASDKERAHRVRVLSRAICNDDAGVGAKFTPHNGPGIRRRRLALFRAAEQTIREITDETVRREAVDAMSVAHYRTMLLTADEMPIRETYDRMVKLDTQPAAAGQVGRSQIHEVLRAPHTRNMWLDHLVQQLPAWRTQGDFANSTVAEISRRCFGEAVNNLRRDALMQHLLIIAGMPEFEPAVRANAIRTVSACRLRPFTAPSQQQMERMAAVAQSRLLLAERADHHSLAAYFTANEVLEATPKQDFALLDAHLAALEHPQTARVAELALPLLKRLLEAVDSFKASPAQYSRLRSVLLEFAKSKRVSDLQLDSLLSHVYPLHHSSDADGFAFFTKFEEILNDRSLSRYGYESMDQTNGLALQNAVAARAAESQSAIENMRCLVLAEMLPLMKTIPPLEPAAADALAARTAATLATSTGVFENRWHLLLAVRDVLSKTELFSPAVRNRLLDELCNACVREDADRLADDKRMVPLKLLQEWPDRRIGVAALRKMWQTFMRAEPAHVIGNAKEMIELLQMPGILSPEERAATAQTLAHALDACTEGKVQTSIEYWDDLNQFETHLVCGDLAKSIPLDETLDRCRAFAQTSSASDISGVLNSAIERLTAYNAKLDTTPQENAERQQLLSARRTEQ